MYTSLLEVKIFIIIDTDHYPTPSKANDVSSRFNSIIHYTHNRRISSTVNAIICTTIRLKHMIHIHIHLHYILHLSLSHTHTQTQTLASLH